MYIFFDIKSLCKKPHALKNACCEKCGKQSIHFEAKWFDWLRVFFIPVFPLGKESAWVCSACGYKKQARRTISVGVNLLLILFLVFFLYLFFNLKSGQLAESTLWICKVVISGALLYAIYMLFSHHSRNKKMVMADVLPLPQTYQCLNCGGCLYGESTASILLCNNCKVISYNKV